MKSILGIVIAVLALPGLVSAQLSGRVGPTTTREEKAAKKICNILEYGGQASKTFDNGRAFASAWNGCKSGGQIYFPPGNYGLGTWLDVSGGRGVAINLEGVIHRISSARSNGNMFAFLDTDDFEFYSANSKGAIQGYGWEFHSQNQYGPRILRFIRVTNFSIHDVALVDAPQFHFTMDTCKNGEVYNMIVHGGDRGGLDGVDVWSENIWIHDVEVSNRDECVTVKSPSKNILIESIYCNLSGGCAIGSLGADTDIRDIIYRNVYSQNSNQMMMIKSRGGSGILQNAQFINFTGHSNAYTLDLNAFWSSQSQAAGNGVQYRNLTFQHWRGTCSNGQQRAPVQFLCTPQVPCTDLIVDDFYVWTEAGNSVLHKCENAFGEGVCLGSGQARAGYSTTTTVGSLPTEAYSIERMPNEIPGPVGLGVTKSIDIPAIPTTFYPGLKPTSARMADM